MNRGISIRRAIALLCLCVVSLGAAACDVTKTVLRQALSGFVAYFDTPVSNGSALTRLTDRTLTFNWYFDRTLVVETEVGLVVVDSFNEHLSRALLAALREAGIDRPVHTLIYTHYHVDHTNGATQLAPREVVCDVKCQRYWNELPPEDVRTVREPTKTVDGDTQLVIGGVPIELISLGRSHTDTMYAVYLPSERLVFAADTVGLDVMLPAGGVAIYTPAYLAALDRLQALDFDVFVSSHFGWGSKVAYVAAADLQRDGYRWAREALARYGTDEAGIAMTQDEARFLAAFDFYYDRMRAKYGDWHGFDAMILNTFTNNLIAVTIGN